MISSPRTNPYLTYKARIVALAWRMKGTVADGLSTADVIEATRRYPPTARDRRLFRLRATALTVALLQELAGEVRDPESVARRVSAGALYPWPAPHAKHDPFRFYFPEDMDHMTQMSAMVWQHVTCPRRLYVRTDDVGTFSRTGLLHGIAMHLSYQLGDRGEPSAIHNVLDAVEAWFATSDRSGEVYRG